MPLARFSQCLAGLLLTLFSASTWAAADDSPEWDGAITLVGLYGPEYLGAQRDGVSLRPGFYARWGRVSVSSGGGFAARREDQSVRGLGIDLQRTEQLRVTIGLRFDSGRRESSSPALAGMGNVSRTVRARLFGEWRPDEAWKFSAAWTVDAFNKGGGNLAEGSVKYLWRLGPRLELEGGTTLTIGGPRYMKTYFGVTPEQSERSGYPVFEPGLGLRDATVSLSLRSEIGRDWVAVGGVGVTRLLGDARDSPLTRRPTTGSLSLGIGYRF